MRKLLPLLIAVASIASCGGGNDDNSQSLATSVSMYKFLGSTQCYGGGTTVVALAQQLSSVGVFVFSSICGNDGLVRPTVCGADDGAIGIFEFSVAQQQAASNLGFSLLSSLSSAIAGTCK